MTMTAAQVVESVGGTKAWKGHIKDQHDVVVRLRNGLPYSVLEALASGFQLELKELAPILDIPWTTLMRRRRAKRFRPDESDRLYRVARIVAMASDVLEDKERASRWLRKPNRSLAGEVPLRLLDTEVGARQVETALGRIEHGVYS
jgi:putative toxin-antitoxin system antitoxin component (TIGR02293 family)